MPSAPPNHFTGPPLEVVEETQRVVEDVGVVLELFRPKVESMLAMVQMVRTKMEQWRAMFDSEDDRNDEHYLTGEAAFQKLDEFFLPLSLIWQHLSEVFDKLKANVRRLEVDQLPSREDEFESLFIGVIVCIQRFVVWFTNEGALVIGTFDWYSYSI